MSKQSVSAPSKGEVELGAVISGGKGEQGSVRFNAIKGDNSCGWATFDKTTVWAFDGIDWWLSDRSDLKAVTVMAPVKVLVEKWGTAWPSKLFAAQQEWAAKSKEIGANRIALRETAEAEAAKAMKPAEVTAVAKAVEAVKAGEVDFTFRGAAVNLTTVDEAVKVQWVKFVKGSLNKGTATVAADKVAGFLANSVK